MDNTNLDNVARINYIFKIISSLVKGKYTLHDFCKEWFAKKLFKDFKTPEEALYDKFCTKTFQTWTMVIPNLPILSSYHKNNFVGECELDDNWNCNGCVNCKYCVNCDNCTNCYQCKKCNNCKECILCRNCGDCESIYNCKHTYQSKYTVNKTNMVSYIGNYDGSNIDCKNCVNCINCIECDNCTDCVFSYNCENCTFLNDELQSKKAETAEELIKLFYQLDSRGMLCQYCDTCNNCSYLYDGVYENDVTIELTSI